ncbi:MAG: hypothetical protein GWN53_17305 [Gammaproteobacteria bacterium]|uniref:Uncharacterized protein n=1 Tax=Candidatus Kutchimonas denitrificans TaxID=3056748 RepID=A0AAE5CC76_9BACT|nr:hypothetical protein [Candidatus Kutchimonas denitrificans]NIV53600.1 hypothetical protein [Gammaproteobacteria bacterium]
MDDAPATLDVDEYLEALGEPSIRIRGEVYRGRYPTFNERLKIARILQEAEDADDVVDGTADRELIELIVELFEMPDAEILLELPRSVLDKVVFYFLGIMGGYDGGRDLAISERTREESTPSSDDTDSGAASPPEPA